MELDTAIDNDAKPELVAEIVEKNEDMRRVSMSMSDDTALDNADANEPMPELLASRLEARAVDRVESITESDDAALCNADDSDSTSALLAEIFEEIMVMDVSVDENDDDTATDNDCISAIRVEALVSIDALTFRMVEFIIVPVDIAEANFDS